MKYNIEKAYSLAKSIAAKQAKFGKLGRGSYTQDELQDAVSALYEKLNAVIQEYSGGLTAEEATKLRRQLAAANARVAKKNQSDDELT